jgi:hypothetical protein
VWADYDDVLYKLIWPYFSLYYAQVSSRVACMYSLPKHVCSSIVACMHASLRLLYFIVSSVV